MSILQSMKLPRNHVVAGAAITGLLMSMVIGLLIVDRMISRAAAPEETSSATQSLFFPYFTVKDGFNSIVGFNNASNLQLTIHPTLYNASGQALAIKTIILGARQQFMANIQDWIVEGGGDATFTQGSLGLSYEAPGPAYLGSQITITNPATSLVFDVSDEEPASYTSSRLEGLWWRPDGASQYNLVLTNTTDAIVQVETIFTGDQKSSKGESLNLTLEPHQIRVLNLKDVKLPLSTGNGKGRMGGISITHSGKPGAVLAYGMLAKSENGFSSNFAFADPAASQSQTLAAAHLLIGRAEMERFSRDTSFTSVALLRNASDAPIEVKPTVSFTSNNEPHTTRLPSRELLSQQVEAVDVEAELKRAGYRGPFAGAGLTLASSGKPGTLVAHLSSFDQTRNHVFDVPLKDPEVRSNRYGGCYPWNIEGDTQSIIHVRNTTDEKALFTIQLDWDGGSYALPIQELAPQQELAIDVRKLRDTQEKDSTGRVIPKEVSRGQATWYEHGEQALIGRTEVFNTSAATASSFSCAPPSCCPPYTLLVFCTPNLMSGVVGESSLSQMFERRYRECDGAQFGPYNVTTQATWSTDNAAVVTVGAVTLSGAQCTCVGLGQANVNANFQGISWEFFFRENRCRSLIVPFPISCPVQVNPPELVGVFTSLVSGDDSATISGQGFALQIEARVPGSNPPRVANFNSPVTVTVPSPSLISGESISANPVPMSQGVGHTNIVLKIVDSSGASCCRSYTLTATGATPGGGLVKIWFPVEMDIERWKNCGFQSCPNLGSYFCTSACSGGFSQPTSFVALTGTGVCNRSVRIRNTVNGSALTTTVQDFGPTNSPYWNTGNIPITGGCITEVLANALGVPNGCSPGPVGRANVIWRFD